MKYSQSNVIVTAYLVGILWAMKTGDENHNIMEQFKIQFSTSLTTKTHGYSKQKLVVFFKSICLKMHRQNGSTGIKHKNHPVSVTFPSGNVYEIITGNVLDLLQVFSLVQQ